MGENHRGLSSPGVSTPEDLSVTGRDDSVLLPSMPKVAGRLPGPPTADMIIAKTRKTSKPTGLERLARLLATTKEEASAEISKLSSQVRALEIERRTLGTALEECQDELGDANSLVAQLRLENTRKWRIEERDDWRALVDSMQADRNTLQEENARLHGEITRCVTILRSIFPSTASLIAPSNASSLYPVEVDGARGDRPTRNDDAANHGREAAEVFAEETPELTHRRATAAVTTVGSRGRKSLAIDLTWLNTLAVEFDVHDLEGTGDEENDGSGGDSTPSMVVNGTCGGKEGAGCNSVADQSVAEECARLRLEIDALNREAKAMRAALDERMSQQENEVQAPRPSIARAESSRLRPGQAQSIAAPQADAHGREGGSLGGMMRWWKQDRGSFGAGRRKSGGGMAVSGDVTVV